MESGANEPWSMTLVCAGGMETVRIKECTLRVSLSLRQFFLVAASKNFYEIPTECFCDFLSLRFVCSSISMLHETVEQDITIYLDFQTKIHEMCKTSSIDSIAYFHWFCGFLDMSSTTAFYVIDFGSSGSRAFRNLQ